MSIRIEWAEAKAHRLEVVEPGEVTDAYGNTNDDWALSLPGVCIEGTPAELRTLLQGALALVPKEEYCTVCDDPITEEDLYNMCEDCLYHAERGGWTPAEGWA